MSLGTNVLITGGAGYIGSVLTYRLFDKGYNVTVLDNLLHGYSPIVGNVNFIRGDIRSADSVKQATKNIDVVIHLAALARDFCTDKEKEAYEVNSLGTKVLLEHCSEVKKFIYASSCSVYGHSDGCMFTEDCIPNPCSVYSKTKLEAENRVLDFKNGTVCRFATVFGPSTKMRWDLVFNAFTLNAFLHHKIVLYGYGLHWRPLIHIFDLVEALENLITTTSDIKNTIFNVGNDKLNIRTIDMAERLMSWFSIYIKYTDKKEVDMRSYKVSSDRLKKTIGFEPSRGLEDAIPQLTSILQNGK